MTKPIAFKATFSDIRQVKGRKVYQLTFEVPAEKADEALEVLGGAPHSEKEVWCGITRLVPGAEPVNEPASATPAGQTGKGNPAQAHQPPTDTGRDRRVRTEAQRAGFLCTTESFQRFLYERCMVTTMDADEAAAAYRDYCGVESRADIDADPDAVERSRELRADFDVWQRALV